MNQIYLLFRFNKNFRLSQYKMLIFLNLKDQAAVWYLDSYRGKFSLHDKINSAYTGGQTIRGLNSTQREGKDEKTH